MGWWVGEKFTDDGRRSCLDLHCRRGSARSLSLTPEGTPGSHPWCTRPVVVAVRERARGILLPKRCGSGRRWVPTTLAACRCLLDLVGVLGEVEHDHPTAVVDEEEAGSERDADERANEVVEVVVTEPLDRGGVADVDGHDDSPEDRQEHVQKAALLERAAEGVHANETRHQEEGALRAQLHRDGEQKVVRNAVLVLVGDAGDGGLEHAGGVLHGQGLVGVAENHVLAECEHVRRHDQKHGVPEVAEHREEQAAAAIEAEDDLGKQRDIAVETHLTKWWLACLTMEAWAVRVRAVYVC